MTHRRDATSDVLGRWRMLAEQRLEHLTELFESGRWRRYHSEVAFLENIREAKEAVETWRALSTGKPAPTHSAALKPSPAAPARPRQSEPPPAIAPRPIDMPIAVNTKFAALDEPASDPMIDLLALERALDIPEPMLDLAAIEQRYPLLRNAM